MKYITQGRGTRKTIEQRNNTINHKNHILFGMGFMETIPTPWTGFLRSFEVNHLASTDNLTRITKRQNTYQRKLKYTKGALINNNTIKNMLRYKTEPGLVALYIWPENGAGLFLQPGSPHRTISIS